MCLKEFIILNMNLKTSLLNENPICFKSFLLLFSSFQLQTSLFFFTLTSLLETFLSEGSMEYFSKKIVGKLLKKIEFIQN